MDTSCALIWVSGRARSSHHCSFTPPRRLHRLSHAHDPTLNSVIAKLPHQRIMLMLVEDLRIARDQTRLVRVDLAKWDASDSMGSRVTLSGLLNALGSVDAQAGGPLTDHHDEGQAIRTSGQRRSSSRRTGRIAATLLHRETLILPHPGVSPSPIHTAVSALNCLLR